MQSYNIRVYGILIKEGSLLVTDEIRLGMRMTKLPGGGLEKGEGLAKCLQREWEEELSTNIEVGPVVYINPFLQVSAFNTQEEVLAVYFEILSHSELQGSFRTKPQDFDSDQNNQQVFRWIPLKDLTPRDFTFPIDQSLVPVLLEKYLR
ncbi:MAG: NUDIX domain-containing protein [Bacteroidota bacterium]